MLKLIVYLNFILEHSDDSFIPLRYVITEKP